MDKEQFQNNMMMFENGIIDYVTFTSRCIEYINSLEAENAKLKEPKLCDTCDTCEYWVNNTNEGYSLMCITCNSFYKYNRYKQKAH